MLQENLRKKNGERVGVLPQAKTVGRLGAQKRRCERGRFEACTYDYGFLIALNLAATVSSEQAWQVQRQSVLSGLGVIG